jgi:hypothetical protein
MKKALQLGIVAVGLCLFSCKKENGNAEKSKTDLLTQSPWVISKYEGKADMGVWTDYWQIEPPCEQDNKWIFKKNRSLEYNESSLACDGGTPNEILDIYNWNFLNNEATLQFDVFEFTIDKLDENELIISKSSAWGEVRYTYRH